MRLPVKKPLGKIASRRLVSVLLTAACTVSLSGPLLAGDSKPFIAHATGTVTSQTLCSPTEVCQAATVSGLATRLGAFTGELFERLNITTGAYAGAAVFTMTNGSTIETEYEGQIFPPSADGTVVFVETHVVVGGTGKFAGATGDLHLEGTATVAGEISIDGVGTLSR